MVRPLKKTLFYVSSLRGPTTKRAFKNQNILALVFGPLFFLVVFPMP